MSFRTGSLVSVGVVRELPVAARKVSEIVSAVTPSRERRRAAPARFRSRRPRAVRDASQKERDDPDLEERGKVTSSSSADPGSPP